MLRSWLNMKRYRDKNAPSGVFSGSARCSFTKKVLKEENIMLLPHFRANFKTGYWEAVFSHTRPLGVVPWDMRG